MRHRVQQCRGPGATGPAAVARPAAAVAATRAGAREGAGRCRVWTQRGSAAEHRNSTTHRVRTRRRKQQVPPPPPLPTHRHRHRHRRGPSQGFQSPQFPPQCPPVPPGLLRGHRPKGDVSKHSTPTMTSMALMTQLPRLSLRPREGSAATATASSRIRKYPHRSFLPMCGCGCRGTATSQLSFPTPFIGHSLIHSTATKQEQFSVQICWALRFLFAFFRISIFPAFFRFFPFFPSRFLLRFGTSPSPISCLL